MSYYRVLFGKRTLCTCPTRDEAVRRCEEHAHKLAPPVVNPSQLKHTTVAYRIKLVECNEVKSTEIYTVIIAMKK